MPMTEEEKVRELRACLERLDGITSTVQSDHMMNLLEDVAGRLPGDKQRMLEPIDRFLNMNPSDREAFIVGRRIGRYRYVSDYAPSAEVEMVRRNSSTGLAPRSGESWQSWRTSSDTRCSDGTGVSIVLIVGIIMHRARHEGSEP